MTKHSVIGKMQEFDADRQIEAAKGMGRMSRHTGMGEQSNKAKLALGKAAAKGMAEGTRKKNRAKSISQSVLDQLDADKKKGNK